MSYTLTAEVSIDGNDYSNQGTIRLVWTPDKLVQIFRGPVWSARVQGDAVPVLLGSRGVVVIALDGNPSMGLRNLPRAIFGWGQTTGNEQFRRYLEDLSNAPGSRVVPAALLPRIVYFPDPARPETGMCIDPSRPPTSVDDASAPEVVGVTLQMTHDPPTFGIDRILPWLSGSSQEELQSYKDGIRLKSRTSNSYDCILYKSEFARRVP